MGTKCFAGYIDDPAVDDEVLLAKSVDDNMLQYQITSRILIDDDSERSIPEGGALELEDGYGLNIVSVSDDRVYVELAKEGYIIDANILTPSSEPHMMADSTYCFSPDIEDAEEMVTIAIHFKEVSSNQGRDAAVADGIWQISDEPYDLSLNSEHGLMEICSVTPDTLTMRSTCDVYLARGTDIEIMPGFHLSVADADDLRYYLYAGAP